MKCEWSDIFHFELLKRSETTLNYVLTMLFAHISSLALKHN